MSKKSKKSLEEKKISKKVIESYLSSLRQYYLTTLRSIKRGIVSGILQFSRIGGIELYGDGVELYRWVVISGVENCSDCLGREGQVDTLEGWEDRGLPGAGWSKCRGNCYCQLVPDTVDSDFALKIP